MKHNEQILSSLPFVVLLPFYGGVLACCLNLCCRAGMFIFVLGGRKRLLGTLLLSSFVFGLHDTGIGLETSCRLCFRW